MKKIISLVSLLLILSTFAFGQRTTGNVEGTVVDPQGAVIPGATVTLQSVGTTAGYRLTVTTNSEGRFFFSQVPVGTYVITVSKEGFANKSVEVTVALDRVVTSNITLEVGGVAGEITVTTDSTVTVDPGNTKIDISILISV